jgi:hypothetical protein
MGNDAAGNELGRLADGENRMASPSDGITV